jgi:hypothetical protein
VAVDRTVQYKEAVLLSNNALDATAAAGTLTHPVLRVDVHLRVKEDPHSADVAIERGNMQGMQSHLQ